jgi:hypothetical protein
MSEYDELAKRVSQLEGELAEAKKSLEALKPKELFERKFEMPRYDPCEGMSAPMSALKPMVDLIHGKGPKQDAQAIKNAWARNIRSEPGGFGPGPGGNWDKGPTKVKPEEELKIPEPPRSLWSK